MVSFNRAETGSNYKAAPSHSPIKSTDIHKKPSLADLPPPGTTSPHLNSISDLTTGANIEKLHALEKRLGRPLSNLNPSLFLLTEFKNIGLRDKISVVYQQIFLGVFKKEKKNEL